MILGISIRLLAVAFVISTFLGPVISVGHSQALPFKSPVTITVYDDNGALITDCEVRFTSDSESVVSYTGRDGSLTVSLQSGRYSVISRKAGFVITKIPEVQVPTSEALRVVMKVDHTPRIDGLMLDGSGIDVDISGIDFDGYFWAPLTEEELRNIPSEFFRLHPSESAPKNRSWRCLYLWKCSKSQSFLSLRKTSITPTTSQTGLSEIACFQQLR